MTAALAETRLSRWERHAEWPLAVLAAGFLAVYAVDILAERLSQPWHVALRAIDYAIWLTFAADFLVRVSLASERVRYLRRHFIDLATILLPILRPLRTLRLVMLLRVLHRRAADTLRGRVAVYGVSTALLLVFCGALAVLDAERHHEGANITNFGDALWWASVTICTVGYGDRFPVTPEGRLIGVGLMVSGVALLGAVTASFATWLIDGLRIEEEGSEAATRRDLAAVHFQLDRIEQRLDALGGQGVEPPVSASS